MSRSWISSLIAIVAVGIVYFLAPSPHYQPRGILLPTQMQRQPTQPSAIKFYRSLPAGAIKLGQINIEKHFRNTSLQDEQAIKQAALNMAASVGANGITVNQFGHTMIGAVPSAQAMYQFQGTAFFLPGA